MKLQTVTKAIIVTLALALLSLNTGCADGAGGKGRKTRISGKAVAEKNKQLDTKGGVVDQTIPTAPDSKDGKSNDSKIDIDKTLKDSTYDESVNIKAQEEYEGQVLGGNSILNKTESTLRIIEFKGKTLTLKRMILKLKTTASNVKDSNYSALSFYNVGEDSSITRDSEASLATGDIQAQELYTLPFSLTISFDENGALKDESKFVSYSVNADAKALSVNTSQIAATDVTLESTIEIINKLTGTGAELLEFSSKTEINGTLRLLKAESSLTVIVEVTMSDYTTQTFALTYSL